MADTEGPSEHTYLHRDEVPSDATQVWRYVDDALWGNQDHWTIDPEAFFREIADHWRTEGCPETAEYAEACQPNGNGGDWVGPDGQVILSEVGGAE